MPHTSLGSERYRIRIHEYSRNRNEAEDSWKQKEDENNLRGSFEGRSTVDPSLPGFLTWLPDLSGHISVDLHLPPFRPLELIDSCCRSD